MQSEKKIMLLLACVNFTHILDFMIVMPLGNYLMPTFNINAHEFTLIVSAYAISAGTSSFISAFFVDNFDRKKVLLFGFIGFILGTLFCAVAPTYSFLLMARIFAGLFGGLIGAQVISIVADLIPYERRGQGMSIVMSSFSVASIIGVPTALYLAKSFGWHAPFILVVCLGCILIPFLIAHIPSMQSHISVEHKEDKIQSLIRVLKVRKQWMALVFSALMMMGHFLIIPFINPFLEFNNGYSKSQTPLIYLVGGFASFLGAIVLGKLSDKYGKFIVYQACILISLPLVIAITNMPPIHFGFVLCAFAVWFVVATGRGIAAQAMVSNIVEPEHRGSFQSFNSCVQQLGTGFASLITGYIVVKEPNGKILHYDHAGYLSVFILIVSLLFAYYTFKRK
jgi:predicted MFS family arabinose efflux permease